MEDLEILPVMRSIRAIENSGRLHPDALTTPSRAQSRDLFIHNPDRHNHRDA